MDPRCLILKLVGLDFILNILERAAASTLTPLVLQTPLVPLMQNHAEPQGTTALQVSIHLLPSLWVEVRLQIAVVLRGMRVRCR